MTLSTTNIKEYLDVQDCIIFNLKEVIRILTNRLPYIRDTDKELEVLGETNKLLLCLEKTSRIEGPEGETWITWGGPNGPQEFYDQLHKLLKEN